MKLALIFDLYQPPFLSEAEFKVVVQRQISPLIRLIKTKSDANFSISAPLSLLEQLDKFGYSDVLSQLKELVDSERVELVGAAANHPLLTQIPSELASSQIVLNEYALGYYFGQRQGFEGENSILVKDIKCFLPSELEINDELLSVLDELNYDYVLLDPKSISKTDSEMFGDARLFSYKKFRIKQVSLSAKFTELFTTKYDNESEGVKIAVENIVASARDTSIVALNLGRLFTDNHEIVGQIETVVEQSMLSGFEFTSLSAGLFEISPDQLSSLEDLSQELFESKIGQKFVQLDGLICEELESDSQKNPSEEGLENNAFWKETELRKISDLDLKKELEKKLALGRTLVSDKYLWTDVNTRQLNTIIHAYKNLHESFFEAKRWGKFQTMLTEISENIVN